MVARTQSVRVDLAGPSWALNPFVKFRIYWSCLFNFRAVRTLIECFQGSISFITQLSLFGRLEEPGASLVEAWIIWIRKLYFSFTFNYDVRPYFIYNI